MGIQQMSLFRRNACAKVTLVAVFITLIALFLRIQNIVESPINRIGNGFFVHDRLGAPETKEEEMNARTQHMRRFCSQFPKRRHISLNLNGTLMYISEKYRLSYCRVAKVGSTFWTQAFLSLSGVSKDQGAHAQKYNSIFDVPRDESHQAIEQHEELTMSLNDSRINSTTIFLVARNPFSRLFSSYIDQIYMPNKWNIGLRMIDTNHENLKQRICPNEVTFEDFLKYVSQKVLVGTDVGLHWAPIFSICEPCSIKLDILAKQETFNEDVEYILNLVGVDQTNKVEIYNALKETNKNLS